MIEKKCHQLVILTENLTLDKNSTRNSSGDEIANVNFLYDDIVHVQYVMC